MKPLLRSQVVAALRSEEHTSELQSRVDISYAVFCLKKKPHGGGGHAAAPGSSRRRHPPARSLSSPAQDPAALETPVRPGCCPPSPRRFFFCLMSRPPRRSPLFPSRPLFR